MQNNYLLKKEFYFSFKSFADSHCGFASTTGGGLLGKPINQPLNEVAEIHNPMFEIFEVEYILRP